MSRLEINLSLDDLDGDKSPEVFISFVDYKERVATTLSNTSS